MKSARSLSTLLLYLFLHHHVHTCESFQLAFFAGQAVRPVKSRFLPRGHLLRLSLHQHTDNNKDGPADQDEESSLISNFHTRRQVGQQLIYSLVASTALTYSAEATPTATTTSTTSIISGATVDCLSDLPPLPANCVRLYLCRHGQTEYNRKRLIQGSRIDAPLNERGEQQAVQLGQALRRATTPPRLMFHSSLQRSRQTADLAAQQFVPREDESPESSPLKSPWRLFPPRAASSPLQQSTPVPPPLQLLTSIGEIDFGGPAEGRPVEEARAQMKQTYAAWAVGDLDVRMAADGESGREILARVQTALRSLVQAAVQCDSRCVAAVAHSTYLRFLLCTVQGGPLIQASGLEQANACVNVIDLEIAPDSTAKKDNDNNDALISPPLWGPIERTIGPQSALFGGPLLSRAPADWSVQIPQGRVLRINEKRHLGDLVG